MDSEKSEITYQYIYYDSQKIHDGELDIDPQKVMSKILNVMLNDVLEVQDPKRPTHFVHIGATPEYDVEGHKGIKGFIEFNNELWTQSRIQKDMNYFHLGHQVLNLSMLKDIQICVFRITNDNFYDDGVTYIKCDEIKALVKEGKLNNVMNSPSPIINEDRTKIYGRVGCFDISKFPLDLPDAYIITKEAYDKAGIVLDRIIKFRDVSDQKGGYYHKYLKYKNKYLALKNL